MDDYLTYHWAGGEAAASSWSSSAEHGGAGQSASNPYRKAMEIIVEDPETMGGVATFRGTRLMVHHIAALLQQGVPIDELKHDYPRLTDAMIEAAPIFVEAHPGRGRPTPIKWRADQLISEHRYPRRA